jgi:hypothetical protein
VSNIHRLRHTDCIFFVTVNRRTRFKPFNHEKEFGKRLDYMHLNPVRKNLVKRPEDWRWSSYNNFALDKATVAACPIQIDDVRLPLGYCA